MGLTANPFHPVTNELLSSYRDAYLRGDLSRTNTELVDAYLQANTSEGDETFNRFHTLRSAGHRVRPVGWVQQQFNLLRTEPARFRRRAASLLLAGVMVSGIVFAGSRSGHPTGNPTRLNLDKLTPMLTTGLPLEATTIAATTTLRGRIVSESGQPLVGATVLDKESGRGASTDAEGNYALDVSTTHTTRLQYGFGGYYEMEMRTSGQKVQNVTLAPDTAKLRRLQKRHWWQF